MIFIYRAINLSKVQWQKREGFHGAISQHHDTKFQSFPLSGRVHPERGEPDL